MAYVAPVVDGKIEYEPTQQKKTNEKGNSNLDKDAFLQLLTAEMQYQDPLEPTSNTEYIAQFATFSQVESLTNMEKSMQLQGTYDLVGKDVIMKVTDKNGETVYKDGRVEYVYIENDEAYLSIKGKLYKASDLDTIVDDTYLNAYNKVSEWAKELASLPKPKLITMDNEAQIKKLRETYEGMSDYEKTFIASDVLKIYNEAVTTFDNLKAAIEETLKKKSSESAIEKVS